MRAGTDLARMPPSSTGWLIPLAVLSGTAVAVLASNLSAPLAIAAVGGVIFLVVFAHRPALGLLFVLFIRSSTDLSFALVHRAPSALTASGSDVVASSPLNAGLILILIFFGGIFMVSRGIPFLRLPGGTPFALLLLAGLIGLLRAAFMVHSESLLHGISEWLRPLSVLVAYALAAHLFRSPRAMQNAIDIMAAAFVIPAAFGFSQLLRGSLPIIGTFVDQNAFGVFLVLIFGIFLGQALGRSGARKLVAMSIVGCSALLLVATYSRTSWIAALVILLVVGAMRKRVLLILVPLAAVLVIGMVPSIGNRLANPFEGSFADRLGIWRTTAPVWMDATLDETSAVSTGINRLVGTGPGTISGLVLTGHGIANMEHNDYLAVLWEYGVLGLVAYLSMYLAILGFGYRTWRRCDDDRLVPIVLSFVAVTAGLMTMSLTDNVFTLTQNQLYFWTLAGLTVAVNRWTATEYQKEGASRNSVIVNRAPVSPIDDVFRVAIGDTRPE